MKDEEMAKQFANNGYALGCTKTPFESAKEGFLAGLKAARQDEQLTKAKEIIKQLLGCLKQDTNDPETNYYVCQYMDKAEQFLKYNDDLENCRGWHSRDNLRR